MKIKVIVANWKMNMNYDFLLNYLKNLEPHFSKLVVLPSLITIGKINERISENSVILRDNIFIGSQDVSQHLDGSHTGQISINMFSDLKNLKYIMVGHSETLNKDSTDKYIVSQKVKNIFENSNLKPIIVFGETVKVNHNNLIDSLTKQVESYLSEVDLTKIREKEIIFAYEPIWSVGTGEIHDLETLNLICDKIKEKIKFGFGFKNFTLIYGGSVNEENYQYFLDTSFDGFLLGYPSTKFNFINKLRSYNEK